jgi:aminoglycoside phosphotransferase (APT) family kinase protein
VIPIAIPDWLDVVKDALGADDATPMCHEKQRNDTWLLRSAGGMVVVKRHRWLTGADVDDILHAEEVARTAGVPVPAALRRFAGGTAVVYVHAVGTHRVPHQLELVDPCAELFLRQLDALHDFAPTWAPTRPAALPRRAAKATAECREPHLVETIHRTWLELEQLAKDHPSTASHVDWRTDNLLFADDEVSAVLDWEAVALLPAAEAIGYAAGSLTHTWRGSLSRPFALPPVMRFLDICGGQRGWYPNSSEADHARLAALFTCAVRVAEDQQRGAAITTVNDLHETLGK